MKGEKLLVKAQKKHIRISPRKLRLAAKAISALPPRQALDRLSFVGKKGARILAGVLKQAIDNAVKGQNFAIDNLKFKEIAVDEGSRYKRRDKSHGARFDPGTIQKRTAHLRIVLEEKVI